MKQYLYPLCSFVAAGSLLTSCQTHNYYGEEHSQKNAGATSAEREKIAIIMQMKKDGLINEAQAFAMADKVLTGTSSQALPAASAPVAATAVPATPATPAAPQQAPQAVAQTDSLSLKVYQPAIVLNTPLRSIGSDSMDRMMQLWEKEFQNFHPQMKFNHEGKGSSTAMPALLESKADIGPMSRPLKSSEIAKFKGKFGYEPIQMRVAVDSLAVFIHPSNPLAKSGLTLTQIDSIFSETCKRGGSNITTWGQLGLEGEWKNAPIRVYSRNTASGTYAYFKERVLMNGEFKKSNKELVGSAEVVNEVIGNKFAIGFSGIAYKTPAVEVLGLAENNTGKFYKPNEINAFSGDYPITRSLYLTLNVKPGTEATDLQKEFVNFVYSQNGQTIVRQDGYFPVNSFIAAQEIKKMSH